MSGLPSVPGYREPEREPPRQIRYGPFAPAPAFLALTLAALALSGLALTRAESDAVFECWRDAPGESPRCVRRSRRVLFPDAVRTTPVILEHDGTFDVLRYDGITLLLPNAPPGPFSAFLNAPEALHMEAPDDDAGGLVLACLLLVLGVFFFPRALVGTAPRTLIVDRAFDVLRVLGPWGRGSIEVPLRDVARVRIETFPDGVVERHLGARVLIERADGSTVPLAPYGRPTLAAHTRAAEALAKAVGVEVEVRASKELRAGPPVRHPVIVVQLLAAGVVIAMLVAVFARG